jgi:hypothetical protein
MPSTTPETRRTSLVGAVPDSTQAMIASAQRAVSVRGGDSDVGLSGGSDAADHRFTGEARDMQDPPGWGTRSGGLSEPVRDTGLSMRVTITGRLQPPSRITPSTPPSWPTPQSNVMTAVSTSARINRIGTRGTPTRCCVELPRVSSHPCFTKRCAVGHAHRHVEHFGMVGVQCRWADQPHIGCVPAKLTPRFATGSPSRRPLA